jgi:integrase
LLLWFDIAMTSVQPTSERGLTPAQVLTFNLAAALPGRASSRHTQRAYFRWIDNYLAYIGGRKPAASVAGRDLLMMALPVPALQRALSAAQLRAWLGRLVQDNHSKQGINQARAAIVTLAELLAEAELLDDLTAAAMSRVRIPRADSGQRPGRWLSSDQVVVLIRAAQDAARSDQQKQRNYVLALLLCTLALRREEACAARWGDLRVQNNRVVLTVRGKGRKQAIIDVPRPLLRALDTWRYVIQGDGASIEPETPLLRRLWKGGRVSNEGLTPEGVWLIISDAADYADLGHVAPHDLRRSVAGALEDARVPIETISRLLRHSNVSVTERYLSKLPKRNEGGVLMTSLLGLDDA